MVDTASEVPVKPGCTLSDAVWSDLNTPMGVASVGSLSNFRMAVGGGVASSR